MNIRLPPLAVVLGWALLCAAPLAAAQKDGGDVDAPPDVMLSLFGGGASGSSGTGVALGWTLGWKMSGRVAVEGGGWWLDEPAIEGFAALLGPRISFASMRGAMPFVSAEVGVFRSSVDATDPDVPSFYLERMTSGPLRRTFDDFVVAGGGGVDVRIKRSLSLRPHGRVLLVTADSNVRAVVMFGVHLAFNFFAQPVLP
jgi:hypothetical protein